MPVLELGRICGHEDAIVEYTLQDETTPTTVVERYRCRACDARAPSQDALAEKGCDR